MRKALVATGMSLAILGVLPAPAANAAGPDQFKVTAVKPSGSGCPQGSAVVEIVGDSRFTVTFEQFMAWVGPGSTAYDHKKFCQLGIDVDVPTGLTFTIVDITHRGSADLAKDVVGTQRASYYWTGESQTGYAQSSIDGPYDGPWTFSDVLKTVKLNPRPCGAKTNLNAKLELGVKALTAKAKKVESSIGQHTADGKFSTTFQIKWLNC